MTEESFVTLVGRACDSLTLAVHNVCDTALALTQECADVADRAEEISDALDRGEREPNVGDQILAVRGSLLCADVRSTLERLESLTGFLEGLDSDIKEHNL